MSNQSVTMPCANYLPGIDAGGNACQRCGTLPASHADPLCPNGWTQGAGGSCVNCNRSGCEHPAEVVKTRKALGHAA